MGKQTKAQIDAANAMIRRVKNDRLTEVEEANSSDQRCRKSNHLANSMANWTNGIRCREQINPDGSKMTLPQEIKFREDRGYGTQKTIEGLKAKLAGEGQDKLAGKTDDELLSEMEAAAA